MARVLAASALVVATTAVVHAGPTRKVHVETEPAGATVYLNDPSDGALCDTPCDIDAPIGKTPIILQRAGYEPMFDTLVVPKGSKKMTAHFELVSTMGTLVIKGAPGGAQVSVDDKDKGKADKLEIESGSHHVVVTAGGKKLYDDTVNIDSGNETEIVAKSVADIAPPPNSGGDGGGIGEGSDQAGSDQEVHAQTDASSQEFIHVGLQMDVGFRDYGYDNPHNTLSSSSGEKEIGQVIAGPAVEVWPTKLLDLGRLPGLSLFVRLQFGLNHQALSEKIDQTGMTMPAVASTSWSSQEVSARYRWVVADTVAIEPSAGFVRDVYSFEGVDETIHKSLPDTDYRSLRIGVRASLLGDLAPYLVAENRIVLSGGYLATEFTGATASGLHGAVGVAIHRGRIEARAEAEITRYSWTFAMGQDANGSTDTIYGFALLGTYAF
jgi:hypothetical protein